MRVLTRLQAQGREEFGLSFTDHSRRARRRALGISNAKSEAGRRPLYRDLLKVTRRTVDSAQTMASALDTVNPENLMAMLRAVSIAHQLRQYTKLSLRVIDQTERRVLQGEQVPAEEKIVSIFEPHTDIIIKDRRETLYGHKICLTSGASGLVTDVIVEKGNPADSTLAVKMIERHRNLFGKPPRQASFDGGFTSRKNLTDIKALGVQDVAFSKPKGLGITEMVKSSWVYRRLHNFRAGIEGVISFLKRGFGLGRCDWRGIESFMAYVYGSVVTCNLMVIARHLLASSA